MIDAADFEDIFRKLPGNYIILLPDAPKFTIVAYNEVRALQTFTKPGDIGRGIFEAFPDNPDDDTADGEAKLRNSLEKVIRTQETDVMKVQKYDIPTEDDSGFEIRYWLPRNIPIAPNGVLKYIVHNVEDVTEQISAQKNENALKENFQQFFNQSNAPFAIISGSDFIFSYANQAYLELMSNRELIGKKIIDAIPELEGQIFLQQLKQVFGSGVAYHGLEVPARAFYKGSNEESVRYFNLSYTPYRDGSGIIHGILAFAHDVTEQVEMRRQEKINKINKQAYDLFMQAPVGICILTEPDYTILLANAAALEILDKTSIILGNPVIESIPELKDQNFIGILDSVIQTGKTFRVNERPVTLIRNGIQETAYLNIVFQPYRDDDAKITGIIAILTEETDHVITREKIEYAEEKSRLAIESAYLGYYEIDLVTDEMLTTGRFNEIWGAEKSIDRKEFARFIHIEDQSIRENAHNDALLKGSLFYEVRLVHKDKSVHWVRVNGSIIYSNNFKPVKLIGVIQDITEQRAFTEELKRLLAGQTDELIEANSNLKMSNQKLEQFASIAAHDLQEPLRKIQMFNNFLVEKGERKEDILKYTTKIRDASERMRGLITELLGYSVIAQKSEDFIPVSLNEILKNVLEDYDLQIQEKNAHIHIGELEKIDGIPLQINQLFFNLIGNALKFIRPGMIPEIRIMGSRLGNEEKKQFKELDQNPDYYEIRISDNGIGFDKNYSSKIFTIFQRLNNKEDYTGYGIGLALCNKVVANHKGLIYAESVPNAGSTFTIILPLKQNN